MEFSKNKLFTYILIAICLHLALLIVLLILGVFDPVEQQPKYRVTMIKLAPPRGSPTGTSIKSGGSSKSKVQTPKPKPEPRPEPKPKPETKPEPRPEPKPKPETKPEPKPKPKPKPETKPEPKPKPKPKPETKPEPKPEPKPKPETKPESKPEPKSKPETKPGRPSTPETPKGKPVDPKTQNAINDALGKIDSELNQRSQFNNDGGATAGGGDGSGIGTPFGDPKGNVNPSDPGNARYRSLVHSKVKRSWIRTHVKGSKKLVATVRVRINASGKVISRSLVRSSSNSSFNQSILRAVDNASPFPAPPAGMKAEAVNEGFVIKFSEF